MNILLVVAILYFLTVLGNNVLDLYITNKIRSYLNIYFSGEKIKLVGKEKEIIDALIIKYTKELTKVKNIPFYSFLCKAKAAYEVYGSIEDLINYLEKEYDFILIPNKEEKNNLYVHEKFFVSYISEGKYITIWFTYVSKEVKIVNGTESFNSLSMKEQYSILLEILKDLRDKKTKDYNFSRGLEEMFMAGLDAELNMQDDEQCSIFLRERKRQN